MYYEKFRSEIPYAQELEDRLNGYISWIQKALPDFSERRYRRVVDLYALLGALDLVTEAGELLSDLDATSGGRALRNFEQELAVEPEKRRREAARYLIAASSQTDNLAPRRTRIGVLERVLTEA